MFIFFLLEDIVTVKVSFAVSAEVPLNLKLWFLEFFA